MGTIRVARRVPPIQQDEVGEYGTSIEVVDLYRVPAVPRGREPYQRPIVRPTAIVVPKERTIGRRYNELEIEGRSSGGNIETQALASASECLNYEGYRSVSGVGDRPDDFRCLAVIACT